MSDIDIATLARVVRDFDAESEQAELTLSGEHPQCKYCGGDYLLRDECEVVALCDHCTHEAVPALLDAFETATKQVLEARFDNGLAFHRERALTDEIAALRAELEQARRERDEAREERDAAQEFAARLCSVVDAAITWKRVADDPGSAVWPFTEALDAAIDEYTAWHTTQTNGRP